MRLFLSSYRAGGHSDRLVRLFGKGSRIAVITNSKDYKSAAERKESVKELLEYFEGLGLKPFEVNLQKYFDDQTASLIEFSKFQTVWLAGGNAFLLRRALEYSGAGRYLHDAVRKNEIILGGESAGAIVIGPTLKYSEVDTDEDSPNYIPPVYKKEIIWGGLGFISYVPVPHYKSPDYIGIDEYIKNLEKDKIPYKTITEGQAIVIDGDKEEFLK